ncbi:MAG: hypothetical protein WDW38_005372 [Sanguina aurantia]
MLLACRLLQLVFLATVAFNAQLVSSEIPHVNSCNFCTECLVTDTAPAEDATTSVTSKHLLGTRPMSDKQQSSSESARHQASLQRSAASFRASEDSSDSISSSDGKRKENRSDRNSRQLSQDDRPSAPPRPPQGPVKARKLTPALDALDDPSLPAYLRVSSYHASARDLAPKFSLPNCTQCYGCSTHLMSMAESTRFADRNFTNEKGATSGWLFRAHTNKTASGIAVVKAYCIPVAKVKGGKIAQCSPATILRTMKLFLAIQRISKDCGFEDMVPRVWIDKIDGVVPSNSYYQAPGYHIRWYGLWMEYVNGISLENFLHRGLPVRFPPEYVINFFENRINKTQAVRAAMFDLLTSQCDRHAQNVFVDEGGSLHLIDNEAAMQHSWKTCGFDSILVPTSQKQEIIRLSNQFVNKLVTVEQAPRQHADPQLTLDYRCWVDTPNEEIGNAYPPKLKQCLARMAGMTLPELQEAYGMQDAHSANVLHRRASDMHNHGFEWTFKYGWPQNLDTKRYRLQPKCCSLRYAQGIYRCNHTWEPLMDLPIGDPITGKAWTKARPDTGTYKGALSFRYQGSV